MSLFPVEWFDSRPERAVANRVDDDTTGVHHVVEVKMDKEMTSGDVRGKRDAARRWANYVTADEKVNVKWRYLLVAEADVETAKGSWAALQKLGES